MRNLLSKKAQFFILTAVMIVGVFFTLSKYINQYSFIDTSKAVEGAEIFILENIVGKANKTVQISNTLNFNSRLTTYKDFVGNMVADRGYTLSFNFTNITDLAVFNITLMSERYTLRSEFSETIPQPTCNGYCVYSGYSSGVCEQNPLGQCASKGGDWQSDGDVYCTGGEDEDTCCCFPAA
ncbi:MAG: hypothetical protein ISS48_01345 [Candidatus Aenigmarchaeota archaeon]|nr:hypothetical protein [Candidatus Aenigmarchaeota archaeon]